MREPGSPCDDALAALYGADEAVLARQRERLSSLLREFEEAYGGKARPAVYSAPGRVELCGNHTDHNNGVVLAAAISQDVLAVAARNDGRVIRLRSRGFGDEIVVDLERLEPDPGEAGRSAALVRGVAAAIRERGGQVGGLDVCMASDVLKGSGLSSSAAFEVCVGAMLDGEYNGGRFDAPTLALMGQRAENVFFGKPCGVMDQLACAVGGVVAIDLQDPSAPVLARVPLDLRAHGLRLVVTDTGGDHSGLTDDYAAIRREMESVAAFFGQSCLREVPYGRFRGELAAVRRAAGDRATVRALHFFEECRRVREAVAAARGGDMPRFLAIIAECGHSSVEFNQNAYSLKKPGEQGIPLALALSGAVLGSRGACRLQGGGFAGTVQAFVPDGLFEEYRSAMSGLFGADACRELRLRERGAVRLDIRPDAA